MRYIDLVEKWTQKYRERGLYDVLDDFKKAGGHWAGGEFGTVFIHPRWSFVYKIFNDECYLKFVRWAARNPHPCLPRFLSKPKWVVPFYRRHKKENKICIVKLEKLNEWKYPPELKDMGGFAHTLEYVALNPKEFAGDEPSEHVRSIPVQYQRWQKTKALIDAHPEFKQLCDFYRVLLDAPIECAPDIHVGNVMQRDDGTLVFTDPYWHGETPYMLEYKALQAETDYDYDEEENERDYVKGGEEYRPPKKRKHRPLGIGTGDDEMPF